MARVELNDLIANVRGSLSKESGLCFRVINGKTYMSRKPGWEERGIGKWKKPVRKPQTKQQLTQQERFKQAHEMCKAIFGCDGLRKAYEAQWKSQKKYVTLRGYVFAKMMQMNKGEVRSQRSEVRSQISEKM